MPWVRFADDYLSNPKVLSLGPLPRLLDVSAIIYSARELRDGQLSRTDVQTVATLARIPKWSAAATELVHAGRWEATQEGYAIHDYLSYQPSRDQVLAERERNRNRKATTRNPGDVRPDNTRNSNGVRPESGVDPAAPYPYPVNSPDPDPEPPRTPPDEQGGRAVSRRGRRRAVEYDQTPTLSPQDEHEVWCPDHAGHFIAECPACRQVELDYVALRLSGVPR